MSVQRWVAVAVIFLASMFSIFSGYKSLYIIYTVIILFLSCVILKRRLSVFLKFIIGMFILGGWFKVTVHGIFEYPYVEATGAFSGTSFQWDQFFIYSSVAAVALLCVSLLNLGARRPHEQKPLISPNRVCSDSFVTIAIAAVLTIYGLNWLFGFYRIGVARDLSLPFGLDAPASFMVYMGAPLLAAIVASDSVVRHSHVTKSALLYAAALAVVAGMVTYSRSTVVIIMVPIALGMYKRSAVMGYRKQSIAGFAIAMIPALIVTLVAVSVVRISVYGGEAHLTSESIERYLSESIGLFVDRWIGAEGMMVAVSSNQSIEMFLEMITESASSGVQSLYQDVSGSQYFNIHIDGMTFLTLPGIFALLAFSGNFFIVFVGTIVTATIGIFVERIVIALFPGNYSLQYFIACALAYHFSQMIFPVLLIPFLVQLLTFLPMLRMVYSQHVICPPRDPSVGTSEPLSGALRR